MGDFVDTALTPGNVNSYLGLVTSEHASKANYIATLTAVLAPLMDVQTVLAGMRAAYDVDTAIGAQLDTIGLWVGASRLLQVPITGVYFSWDTAGQGWGQGVWLGPGASPSQLTILGDDQFRTLIRARIANNGWDGSIPGAYGIGAAAFGTTEQSSFIYRSKNINTANNWNFVNSTVTQNTTTSPDATVNASTWQRASTATADAGMGYGIPLPSAWPKVDALFTFSLFAKSTGNGHYLAFQINDNVSGSDLVVDITNGTLFLALGLGTATITPLPNGWYRVGLTRMIAAAGNGINIGFNFNNNGTTIGQVDSVANSSGFVYGAQLENTASPSPYLNDISIVDQAAGIMTQTIRVRGPALDAVTKAMVTGGALDLTPAGVLTTYNVP